MSKEFKVGLLAVVTAVMMYFGFNFLRGIDFFSPTNKYYAVYHHIDGLTVSNPVVINGLAVGRVSSMRILQQEGNQILVELDVDERVQITSKSRAKLTSTDFLGSKAIQIEMSKEGRVLESGDTLFSFVDGGLAEIMQKAEPITDNLGVTISSINKILKGMEGSGEVLKSSLQNLDQTLKSVNQILASSQKGIPLTITTYQKLGDSLTHLTSDFRAVAQSADQAVTKMNELDVKKIESSLTDLSSSIDTMIKEITEGDGSLGKIIQDDSLYNNLNNAAISLDQLLMHFDQNPKHFLSPLGKKASKIKRDREKQAKRQ